MAFYAMQLQVAARGCAETKLRAHAGRRRQLDQQGPNTAHSTAVVFGTGYLHEGSDLAVVGWKRN